MKRKLKLKKIHLECKIFKIKAFKRPFAFIKR